MSLDWLLALGQVLLIDLVLAGDNAIVVGMAAAGLPPDQRRKAILWGIGAATIMRIGFAAITTQLLAIVGLTLMGGLPGVGVRLRCVATDEEYFYPSSKMSVNSVNRLCFPTDIDFTPGEWEAIIGSQYTPTYHLYKKERYGYLTFTVV